MLSRLVRQTNIRLAAAGITPDDPALARIREWNAALTRAVCDWPSCPQHGTKAREAATDG